MDLPILVEKVIYSNDKGFTILACSLNPYSSKYSPDLEDVISKNVKPNKYNNFAVTIDMMNPHENLEGAQYVCMGDFIKHPKFGEQFKAGFMYVDEPVNEDGLRSYLMMLPNIKESRSNEIIKKFGFKETMNIFNNDIMRLTEINGITEARILPIKEAWERGKGERELCIWLNEHGIQPSIGKKVYSMWHQDSLKILKENPYRLTEIKGFGFLSADQMAHKILINVPKSFRIISCLRHLLQENLRKNSNLCMLYSELRNESIKLLKDSSEKISPSIKFETEEYKKLIPKCIKEHLDIFVVVKNIHETNNGTYVYLKTIWEREKYIASEIYNRRVVKEERIETNNYDNRSREKEQFYCDEKDLEDAEKDVNAFSHRQITLDDCQKEAIRSAFENKMTVITGSGGTGKSMICRCIYHLAREKNLSIRMMSPTGKAARVLSDKTSFTAETIHRSLKMKPGDDYPTEKITEDIIIIDESSMIGIDTMFAIMYAMKSNIWGHMIFVGDSNQLPSVSPGNFLFDIINSNCVNVVRLNKIHRQDEHSFIPILANDISSGKIVDIPECATDIKWNNLSSVESWDVSLKKVVRDFLSGNSIDDLQIIAPMYKGFHGVNKSNEIMQDLMSDINGSKPDPFHRGFATFYIGDRVIQTENNYDKSIFNGDIGKVTAFGRKATNPNSDEKKDYVTVNFYGDSITYVEDEIEQLSLGWCLTVHKFQGSQCPFIIFLLSSEASNMLTKELLYTAMTRASNRLDLYGHMKEFRLAPTKSAIRKRYTNLNNMINELKDNQKIFKILE